MLKIRSVSFLTWTYLIVRRTVLLYLESIQIESHVLLQWFDLIAIIKKPGNPNVFDRLTAHLLRHYHNNVLWTKLHFILASLFRFLYSSIPDNVGNIPTFIPHLLSVQHFLFLRVVSHVSKRPLILCLAASCTLVNTDAASYEVIEKYFQHIWTCTLRHVIPLRSHFPEGSNFIRIRF